MFHRNLWLSAILGLVLLLPNMAWAQVFLVGAGYYSSEADGANSTLFGGGYLYSTNPNTGSFSLPLNLGGNIQGTGISFALAPGNNNFTFSVTSPLNPGSFGGLMLFFNSTGTSFNPPPGEYAGNLVAVTPTTNTGAFIIPAAGILTRSYSFTGTAPYSGDTVYSVGDFDVSITAFSSDTLPSGSFTLTVASAAVPEPATWAMIALAGCSTVVAGWRFKKKRYRRRS